MNAVLGSKGFLQSENLKITSKGPYSLPNHKAAVSAGPCYLVSPLNKDWLTIIELHFALGSLGVPDVWELAHRLSAALPCHVLALAVHDDDVFYYCLWRDRKCLDHYNSCPQHFERKRLSEEQINKQRHSPEPFEALLPSGTSLDDLRALLHRGWWNAHDSGALDEHGVERGAEDRFVFEGERMTAFGTLLQLHGTQGKYPYAAWGEAKDIDWSQFIALRYRKS